MDIAVVAGAGFFFDGEAGVSAGHYGNQIAALGRIRRAPESSKGHANRIFTLRTIDVTTRIQVQLTNAHTAGRTA
jgi:hypothetical protein